jgi:hypothetical protein
MRSPRVRRHAVVRVLGAPWWRGAKGRLRAWVCRWGVCGAYVCISVRARHKRCVQEKKTTRTEDLVCSEEDASNGCPLRSSVTTVRPEIDQLHPAPEGREGSHFCHNKKAEHEEAHIYFEITKDGYRQRCNCKGSYSVTRICLRQRFMLSQSCSPNHVCDVRAIRRLDARRLR